MSNGQQLDATPFPAGCCLVAVVVLSFPSCSPAPGPDPGITGGCHGHQRGCSTRCCCSTAASGLHGCTGGCLTKDALARCWRPPPLGYSWCTPLDYVVFCKTQ